MLVAVVRVTLGILDFTKVSSELFTTFQPLFTRVKSSFPPHTRRLTRLDCYTSYFLSDFRHVSIEPFPAATMVFEGKLAYPGDFEWGAISKTRTRLWSMKQIRLQLPEAQAQQLKATAAELSQRSKDSFMHTVKFLSDGQFSLTVSRMGSMTTVSPSPRPFLFLSS